MAKIFKIYGVVYPCSRGEGHEKEEKKADHSLRGGAAGHGAAGVGVPGAAGAYAGRSAANAATILLTDIDILWHNKSIFEPLRLRRCYGGRAWVPPETAAPSAFEKEMRLAGLPGLYPRVLFGCADFDL